MTISQKVEPVSLGSWPTPLEAAPRLASSLGLHPDDLWIKRDDLSGLGGGGNKVRKLEHTCAIALKRGAAVLVTSGAAQSNHARLTAAAAARLGMDAVLVLKGEPNSTEMGNLLLDGLLGATIVWAGDVNELELAARVDEEAERLRTHEMIAEVIPYGGSSVPGARGYVAAARELLEQLPDLATVVVAVGSGGTMAGLVYGLGAQRVLGVDTGAVEDAGERVETIVRGLADGDGSARPRDVIRLRTDQVGAGYGCLTDPVRRAIRLVARREGILLDPVYTGRAAAGLVAAVNDGSVKAGERTVLLHSGGLPGLFGHPDARSLAET